MVLAWTARAGCSATSRESACCCQCHTLLYHSVVDKGFALCKDIINTFLVHLVNNVNRSGDVAEAKLFLL